MLRALLLLLLVGAPALAETKPETDEQRRQRIDQLLFPDDPRVLHDKRVMAEASRAALGDLRLLLGKRPGDPELLWLQARALMAVSDELGADKSPRQSIEDAIGAFLEARRAAPDGPRAEEIASDLGILYSKLTDFPRALAEYDRALALHRATHAWGSVEDPAASNLYGNSAETLMALGRLPEAIDRYRAAAESAGGHMGRALAWFGLAAAYDRDEQLEKSDEAMRQALALDPPMEFLSDPDVFFMPLGEKHYYLALGYLARGEPTAAAAAFRAFLSALPASRWAARARVHLDELARSPVGPGRVLRVTVGAVTSSSGEDLLLQGALQANEARLRNCFPRESFTPTGTDVELLLEARAGGLRVERVDGPRVAPGTVRCLENVAREWRFGATRTTTTLHVPLRLEQK